jgi:site-specific DNA recombinase
LYLSPGAAARKRETSSGLKTTGSLWGWRTNGRWLAISVRPSGHKDRLAVRLRSRDNPETINLIDGNDPTGDPLLSIPWQKPPSKRFRQILLPHGSSRKDIRPERPERRLRLVSAIARGRRWLDEMISGSVTEVEQIASRERCSVRHVNMTISLAFLAPRLVRAAVEGRLPRGINIERLRDAPAEWSRLFEALGLNPQQ